MTTILTITLEKKTQIFKFQLQKLSFCSSNVLGTFLYKKSPTQVKIFNHKSINYTSVDELSHRIAEDFVIKTTSNCQGKVNLPYFFRINIPLLSRLT